MPSSSAMAASKSLMVGSTDVAYAPPARRRRSASRCSMHRVHGGFEGPAFKGHVDPISGVERGCVPNDTRSRGVPRDRIAAAEHGQRAEPLDARGQRADPPLRDGQAAPHGRLQLRLSRHQSRANRAKPMPRIELIERAAQQLVTPRAPRTCPARSAAAAPPPARRRAGRAPRCGLRSRKIRAALRAGGGAFPSAAAGDASPHPAARRCDRCGRRTRPCAAPPARRPPRASARAGRRRSRRW